jgi:nucleoside-diphosphate-sugar epimerase
VSDEVPAGQDEQGGTGRRFSGTPCLVAGINGFLGANLAVAAERSGAAIAGVDLPGGAERGERVRAALGAPGLALLEADLTSPAEWARAIRESRPAAVFHLAGSTSRGSTEQERTRAVAGNVETTAALLQALEGLPAAERPVIVYPGSQMEYGLAPPPWTESANCRPANPYAEAKLRSTELLLAAATSGAGRICVARLPLVFGPGQPPTMFVPELIRDALTGTAFRMTEGLQRRRFVHAADVAAFMLDLAAALLEGREPPPLLNAPCSEPTSMREVAGRIVRILDRPVRLEIGAIPQREGEFLDAWPDDDAARALGHSCRLSLDEGLRETVRWYEANVWFGEGGA